MSMGVFLRLIIRTGSKGNRENFGESMELFGDLDGDHCILIFSVKK